MTTSKQRHVIKKQILELELSSKKGAFELQNQISQIYRDQIVPLIDRYCNQLSSPDVINKINSLELDLGNIDINNLEQDLIQAVEAQIKQQLTKKIKPSNLLPSQERSQSTTSNTSQERSQSTTSNTSQERSQSTTSNTSQERSQSTTSNTSSERSQPTTSNTSSERSQPTTSNTSQERSQPTTSNTSSERSQPTTSNTSSERSQSTTSNTSQERSQSTTSNTSSERSQPTTSNTSQERSQSTTSNTSQERSQPTTSNTSQERSQSTTSNTSQERSQPTTSNTSQERSQSTTSNTSQERSQSTTSNTSQERSQPTTLETISYFIQTGTLPWYSEKLSKQELENLFEQQIETNLEQVKRLLIEFFKNQNYLKRIIYQFSDSTLIKITKLFSVKLSQFITDYNNEIQQILSALDNFQHVSLAKSRLVRWQGIFLGFTFNQNNKFQSEQFVRENLLHLATSFSINYTYLINNITNTVECLQQENKNTFKSQLPEILVQIQAEILQPDTSKAQPLPTQPQWQDSQNISSDPFSDADEIYINNSGLILLWPFYKQLFTKIGLLEKNKFIDADAAQKAVLILQYLVDASTEIPESNLPLNKILCGINISEPIETSLDISETEIAECETLLAAAIANWSILKNTSIDGFRQTFLQRDGIIKIRYGSWLLQVERQTYDILLDKIPWGIRVVKLPWINELSEILHVEW